MAENDQERPQRKESLCILRYIARRATKMAGQLPDLPDNLDDWRVRREQVRRDLSGLLGLPPREPMKAHVLGSEWQKNLEHQSVEYLWAGETYVTATVTKVAAIEGRLPAIVKPPGWAEAADGRRDFTMHMAYKGYLVIEIDDPRVGKRNDPFGGHYAMASATGTQAMGVQVFDTLRALDYLLTRIDVDPGRIGIAGLCQGSEQTWLAAALDDRFKVAVPVCGTTTFEQWARMPAELGNGLSDPSPYVGDILKFTDWHEIDACIAPRPVLTVNNSEDWWWPLAGYEKSVAAMQHVYGLYDVPERFAAIRRPAQHDYMPFIEEIEARFEKYLKPLDQATDPPQPCEKPTEVNYSIIQHCQKRLLRQAAALPKSFTSVADWNDYRAEIVRWLGEVCAVDTMVPGEPAFESTQTDWGVAVEKLTLPMDDGFDLPVTHYCGAAIPDATKPAVILSHDHGQCMADETVVALAKPLATQGHLVYVPEHVAWRESSERFVNRLIDLYGCGDTVGLPPLGLQAWDNLRVLEYLKTRTNVDQSRIAVVGLGVGGVDAALAAALDEGITAVAALGGVTTVQDWAMIAPQTLTRFERIMPYLPNIMTKTDLQYFFAAAAPRPLLLVDTGGGERHPWPASGFGRVAQMAGLVYKLLDAPSKLSTAAASTSGGVDELLEWLGKL